VTDTVSVERRSRATKIFLPPEVASARLLPPQITVVIATMIEIDEQAQWIPEPKWVSKSAQNIKA